MWVGGDAVGTGGVGPPRNVAVVGTQNTGSDAHCVVPLRFRIEQDPLAEECKAATTIHLAFDQLQAINLPLHLTIRMN